MKKSDVNGNNQLPLYKFFKSKQGFKGFSGIKGFFFSWILKIFGNSNIQKEILQYHLFSLNQN